MEKKLQYSIFPPPPQSPTSPPPTRGRASIDRERIHPPRTRLPPAQKPTGPPPSNPPQVPLPPPPTQHAAPYSHTQSRSQQSAPPNHNSYAPLHAPPALETYNSFAKNPCPAPQTMHTHSPASSTSSSASLTKAPIHSPSPPSSPEPQARTRPRTVYFHGGIGGAGNYRKVVRENAHAPLAHAHNAQTPRSSGQGQGRFLSSLFGSGKRRRDAPGGQPGSKAGSRQDSREVLPLGAAEAMRRKMLGPRRSSEKS